MSGAHDGGQELVRTWSLRDRDRLRAAGYDPDRIDSGFLSRLPHNHVERLIGPLVDDAVRICAEAICRAETLAREQAENDFNNISPVPSIAGDVRIQCETIAKPQCETLRVL